MNLSVFPEKRVDEIASLIGMVGFLLMMGEYGFSPPLQLE